MVQVGVYSLGTHIRDRPDGGIARVHRLGQNPTDSEIGNLNVLSGVDKKIRGLDVPVHDVPTVEISDPAQDLAGHVR
uniref:Uncharacterized protein MANES_03G097700 n=1 Tax=Rhizophora mucronata TaxID=61149 RepID=A0A2P2KHE7_RHIMU